jgi:hypothetical protein
MPAFSLPLSLEAACSMKLCDLITSVDEDGDTQTVKELLDALKSQQVVTTRRLVHTSVGLRECSCLCR